MERHRGLLRYRSKDRAATLQYRHRIPITGIIFINGSGCAFARDRESSEFLTAKDVVYAGIFAPHSSPSLDQTASDAYAFMTKVGFPRVYESVFGNGITNHGIFLRVVRFGLMCPTFFATQSEVFRESFSGKSFVS